MDIVYEDKRIVVAVKPAGVVSVDQPGGMPELLRQTLHTACIRTVHRLDAPVAGLMVFARSAYAAGELSRQIREGEFEKTYLAVVRGMPEADEGELTDLLGRDKTRRMTYVAEGPGKDVREARLRYRVLDRRAGCALAAEQGGGRSGDGAEMRRWWRGRRGDGHRRRAAERSGGLRRDARRDTHQRSVK